MKTTVLFDLDGTLLPMDLDKFMKLYFYNLGVHFQDLIDPKDLMKYVLDATKEMVQVNDGRTNEDIFMDYFASYIDGDIEVFKPRFEAFYDTLFAHVQPSTYQSTAMLKSVDVLKAKGYDLILATNPLFPYKANVHRIKWAGLDIEMFDYISSFEENHYCKPHVEFYQEILDITGKKAEDCFMVGNDVYEDLQAGKLGMETFLVTNCLVDRHNIPYKADHTGDFEDFYSFVQSLEDLTKR